jgi:hypothetical protein
MTVNENNTTKPGWLTPAFFLAIVIAGIAIALVIRKESQVTEVSLGEHVGIKFSTNSESPDLDSRQTNALKPSPTYKSTLEPAPTEAPTRRGVERVEARRPQVEPAVEDDSRYRPMEEREEPSNLTGWWQAVNQEGGNGFPLFLEQEGQDVTMKSREADGAGDNAWILIRTAALLSKGVDPKGLMIAGNGTLKGKKLALDTRLVTTGQGDVIQTGTMQLWLSPDANVLSGVAEWPQQGPRQVAFKRSRPRL